MPASPRPLSPQSTLDAEEVARRRHVVLQAQADLLVRQTRTSTIAAMVTAISIALVLGQGGLRIPMGLWAVSVMLSFLGRDAAVRWIQRTATEPAKVLEFTGWVSALLAIIITLPAPLLFPEMSPNQRGIFFGVVSSWMAVAGLVNGVHPPTYRVYLFICTAGMAAGWWRAAPGWEATWLTLMLMAGVLLLGRFSQRLAAVLIESVGIRDENTRLVHQLEQALEDTESAQRARSRFLAAASHDLLQPVHALLLLTGLIRRVPPARRDEVAQRIEVTAEAVDAMFRGLLDLARIDAGTLTAQRSSVSLAAVCEAVRAAYESRCAEAGLSLTTSCAGGINTWGDPTLLDRVLRNLVDNAVKFTRDGGIRVTCTAQGPHAVLTVSDTGIGIESDDLQQICAPFFRGRGAREGGIEGLGLGLAITAHMIHLMQGTIAVDSVRGRGTTVRIQLPLAPASTAPASLNRLACAPLRYGRIVLIEDDRLANDATSLWLQEHGAQVIAATSVNEALQVCRNQDWSPPDFILADFLLGDEVDGLQGIALLREALGWCPAALVSGENLSPSLLPGDVSFLSKPLKPERLEALLSQPN